jgi:hypothetical protein
MCIILSCIILQPLNGHASFIKDKFDEMRELTFKLLGVQVDFVGTGINDPQPSCDSDGAKWDFQSSPLKEKTTYHKINALYKDFQRRFDSDC